jgi:hypothetical protein
MNVSDLKSKNLNENYFMFPRQESGKHKTGFMNLHYKNLKPKTRYKILLNNTSGGNNFEDLTEFCMPYGSSRHYNTHRNNKIWRYFVSTSSGELFIRVRTFGVNSVDPLEKDWADMWRFFNSNGKESDVGRTDIKIVEYGEVVDAGVVSRFKSLINFNNNSTVLSENGDQFVTQNLSPRFIQTFYLDPNIVGKSKTCDLLDVVLYFRGKPGRLINTSGVDNPGVIVYIVDIENGRPLLNRQYRDSIVFRDWHEITHSSSATVETVFNFKEPLTLQTGKFYGICVDYADSAYILWKSKSGHALVGTNKASSGPDTQHRGSLFGFTNTDTLNNPIVTNLSQPYSALEGEALKFDLHVAEYDIDDVNVSLTNQDYEFIFLDDTTHNFWAGEYVYQQTANSTGTISISAGNSIVIGTGTDFSTLIRDDKVVLVSSSNTQIVEVGTVDFIESNTKLKLKEPSLYTISGNYKVAPVAVVEHYDFNNKKLYLNDSNATTTKKFEVSGTIIGAESGEISTIANVAVYPISVFRTDFNLFLPANFSLNAKYDYSYDDNGTFRVSNTTTFQANLNFINPNYVTDYSALILSKSLEVDNSANMHNGKKSTVFNLSFNYDSDQVNKYSSPTIDLNYLNTINTTWQINNDAANEHTNFGSALTKHISRKLTFGEGQAAEDIRVIVNAYRPIGTNFKVYAKIQNASDPDAFDDKNWTELEFKSGSNSFSNRSDVTDFREYELGFPDFPPSDQRLDGSITTSQGNNIIVGSGTSFTTTLNEGDIVKIYSPLFPENYGVFSIETVDSDTQLTLTETIEDVNIIDEGLLIDTLTTPYTAFINKGNQNIVRYFGFNGESYDTYSIVSIKTVLLSSDSLIVPRIDDYRVIGVSA